MRKFLILALPLILSGCLSSTKHELDAEWRPLVEIRERPALVRDLGSKTAITTIGTRCYVRDLDEWLGRKPPGSREYRAVLLHEREHSRRQIAYGTWSWVGRYLVDKEFALLEEQIGYYYEMRAMGLPAEHYAAVLSNYKIPAGKLISYEDALTWARDVFAGRWTPPAN